MLFSCMLPASPFFINAPLFVVVVHISALTFRKYTTALLAYPILQTAACLSLSTTNTTLIVMCRVSMLGHPILQHPPAQPSSTNRTDGQYYEDSTDEDVPLLPGFYHALYAFEPEGSAEVGLVEDQIVIVVGRGGGVG
ncbi:hypothetical protein K435DRAFT_418568 [Dendrothele bispora CBS 962.96]|uniref:SH3 domain-containing protein n=1 Tax=Dendrothele bispora (strain CBS 962.96) TaxID=1314807 RepID=A0A4V4HIK5_DENBC|nr:hypothetical protein K435DRAFT_418568 [Dendrothele bispora CBS 962.96]